MKEKAKNRQEEKAGMAQDKNEAHPKMLDADLSLPPFPLICGLCRSPPTHSYSITWLMPGTKEQQPLKALE